MTQRSPLALAVLALLFEAPMHPYLMQRLIKERGKDQVVYVGQRASLYKTIDRLRRDGLIAVRGTARGEGRPERTVYEITAAGRATVTDWTREMLSTPRPEYPEFPAAMAHVTILDAADALRRLEDRRTRLDREVAELAAANTEAPEGLPRLFLLEGEYLHALRTAELAWLDSVIADLRAGRITWSAEWLAEVAAKFSPPTDSPER